MGLGGMIALLRPHTDALCLPPDITTMPQQAGRAIPNPNIINKLDRALGVHLPRGKK